jgi:hypothetical protein
MIVSDLGRADARAAGEQKRESLIMSIGKTRSALYKAARILGDINAVKRGTVGKRITRRVAGRATGRGLGKLFK